METRLEELVQFAHTRGGRCFAGWDAQILQTYLKWHAGNGTLVYVTKAWPENKSRILGLMTVTRVNETELGQHWKFDERGDALVVENAIALRPNVLTILIQQVQAKFPDWRTLKIFARRRSKKGWEQHRYPPELVERLIL